ncbi:MAG: hypothetical protein KF809_00305 [Chloroflexi bacterium]|nr:hypothetical protein [Chloroflexota bacterium]
MTASLLIDAQDAADTPRTSTAAGPSTASGTPMTDGDAPGRARRRRALAVVTEPRFAHASEAELARILDFYMVRWEYEPRTFPILWNLEGQVVESFAPDFYLPDLDLWLELTTLRQSLVRKKNRKLRRLRELYPMLRIKLLYARDFRALMLKYGRLDVAASLIGTDGQMMTPVVRPDAPAAEGSVPAVARPDAPAADVARSAYPSIEPVPGRP